MKRPGVCKHEAAEGQARTLSPVLYADDLAVHCLSNDVEDLVVILVNVRRLNQHTCVPGGCLFQLDLQKW